MVFFSSGREGGEQVDYGYKGKGVTSHLLVEKSGRPLVIISTPASSDERLQVFPVLSKIRRLISKVWQQGKVPILEADKGYDAKEVRMDALFLRVFPMIAYRKKTKGHKLQGVCYLEKQRWVVERTISWLKTRFRRLSMRWKRETKYWDGFLLFGLVGYWTTFLSRWMFK